MIHSINEKISVKVLGITLLVLISLILWAYLAGGIFLSIYGKDVQKATPLTIYQYWYYYGQNAKVGTWLFVSSLTALGFLSFPAILFFAPAKRKMYGDARFATKKEIRKVGLFSENGILLGMVGKAYLMFDGLQHVVLSAPTRAMKGVSIVLTNLLNWSGSVVVSDIKNENFMLTSAFRARCGQRCYLFNPAAVDYRSHRYNPLSYISDDENFRIDDIQKIANMIYPDKPGTDTIWTATPRSLFLGIVLSLIETPGKTVSLGQVLRESLVDGDGKDYFDSLIEERKKNGKPFSGHCERALRSYTSIKSDNTRSGVIASFRSALEIWSNPIVDAATSGNDFDLRDLRKKKMSIYVGVTPDNLERLQPVLNLFFQQVIDINTRELPGLNPDYKHKCLLLMDEFTALGKLNVLSKGISYVAGYWLRLLTVVQSPSQIVEVYGKDAAATFTQNHAAQIIFSPKKSDIETCEQISKWLGNQTVKSVSDSRAKGLFQKRSPSESITDKARPLLLPQEVSEIGVDNEIVIVEHANPIMAKKAVYYRLPDFIDRLKSVSASLARIKGFPSQDQIEKAMQAGELSVKVPLLIMPSDSGGTSNKVEQVEQVAREINDEDVSKFHTFSLDQFSIDFTGISKPISGALDVVGLKGYADDMCRAAGIEI